MTPAFGGQYSIQLSYGRYVWAAYSTSSMLMSSNDKETLHSGYRDDLVTR